MSRGEVIIIGGGIAGLAAAWSLARRGRRVTLFEREVLFASHSSGRNAAIFRQLDGSPGGVALAVESRRLLDGWTRSSGGWLRATGAIYVAASEAGLTSLVRLAEANDVAHRLLTREALWARAPELRGGAARFGLEVPGDGVIDVHLLCTMLAVGARAAGATLVAGVEVGAVAVDHRRVEGVVLASGERRAASEVVLAAGAWTAELLRALDLPLALTPLRRHLALLETPRAPERDAPVIWRLDDEVYFRSEPGGVLASPCDEDTCPPSLPPERPEARLWLAEKLTRLAPTLADAAVRRSWACLRTFAPDRAMVIGADPRVAGLYLLAGLGGHGMTAGVAAGALLARVMAGERSPDADVLSPARLLPTARR